jgi:hypothetical protein
LNRLIVNENPYFGRGFLVYRKKKLKISEKKLAILKSITIFVETIKINNYENNI